MRSRFVPFLAAAALAASISSAAAYQAYATAPVTVHGGPGLRFAVVTTVPAGAPLDVMACGPRWCQVQYIGGGGFVAAPFLVVGAPPPPPAVAASPFDVLAAPFGAIGSVFGEAAPPAPPTAPPPPVVASY